MPLDLPPPLPPQQAEVAVLERRAGAAEGGPITLEVGKFRLLVHGNTLLEEARIREVTDVARTPSQAILLLNALYSADGHPFVTVQYARDGQTIYVQVNEGYLAEVDAPPTLQPYFEPFEGQRNVTASDIEPARILAELKATRAGYTMSGKYSVDPDDPEALTWTIDGKAVPDHDPWKLSATFGNPGNRFLGRYFGLASAEYAAPNGDLYSLGYAHGFTGLGSSRGGEAYDSGTFNYSTVSRWGLYGLNASYTDYEVTNLFPVFVDDREDAEIIEAGLTGSQFLYASDASRWTLEQSLEYVDSTIEFTDDQVTVVGGQQLLVDDQPVQDEQYGAARLGTTASHSWQLFERNGNVNGGIGYKRGFGGHIDSDLSDARRTRDFDIIDASFDAAYELPWNMLVGFNAKTQQSRNDRLPQQQQWVLGGPDNLSAFLPGVLVGDSGTFARLRLQLPPGDIVEGLRYRFSLFVEGGRSKFENADGALGETRSLSDAGIKLEVALRQNLQLTVHVAEKLSDSNVPDETLDAADSDAFFNVRAQF